MRREFLKSIFSAPEQLYLPSLVSGRVGLAGKKVALHPISLLYLGRTFQMSCYTERSIFFAFFSFLHVRNICNISVYRIARFILFNSSLLLSFLREKRSNCIQIALENVIRDTPALERNVN